MRKDKSKGKGKKGTGKAKRRVRLNNTACAYCHRPFDSDCVAEEEHVVGLKFVPKGTLAGDWNLTVQACGKCNDAKSALENDLSAISMLPDFLGRFPPDPIAQHEANRKQDARSQRTGKAVRESVESFTISGTLMPGLNMSIEFVSGPQVDEARVWRLAYAHVAAFFYLITYDKQLRRGARLPGSFSPIAVVARADWGNSQLLGFQSLISGWQHRVHAIAAQGYFKAVIRRSPTDDEDLWAWALEWNKNLRLFGFFGNAQAAQAEFDKLPDMKQDYVGRGVDPTHDPHETWGRVEVSLAEADDHLFDPPVDPSPNKEGHADAHD